MLSVQISEADREMIKKNIVGLMLKTPEAFQRQLSDAITIIGGWSLGICERGRVGERGRGEREGAG